MKEQLKSFLSFSKKEHNGLLIFCLLILLIQLSPSIYSFFKEPDTFNFEEFEKEIEEFEAGSYTSQDLYEQKKNSFNKSLVKPEYFDFDPNGLEPKLWKKLGLSDRQIKVIKNFEARGGHFYKEEDLKKIYSVTPEDYIRLFPYIKIAKTEYKPNRDYINVSALEKKIKAVIEINTADSTHLETLTGIGPAFASRIIKYRNRLGGFYKKEQLLEVYGLDSAKFENLKNEITVNTEELNMININTATFDDLKKHPYLTYKQMNAILQYRKQHGVYKNASDLKNIVILNETVISQIAPYLNY